MIRNLKFKNFYSFKDEQHISFLAKRKKTYSYFKSDKSNYVTKVAGFIGPNASGKTNIIRIFGFLKFFISGGNGRHLLLNRIERNMGFKTFFNNSRPFVVDLEFEIGNTLYFYGLKASGKYQKVIEEYLKVKGKKKGDRTKLVFARNKTDIKLGTYLKDLPLDNIRKHLREDMSLINFLEINYKGVDIIHGVFEYFKNFKVNINEAGQTLHPHLVGMQIEILNKYYENADLRQKVEKALRLFDLGVSGFDIRKYKIPNGFRITVKGKHKLRKERVGELKFNYESSGTQNLFFILGYILDGLKNNSVIAIDELSTGLHPEAVSRLVQFVIEQNREKKAQFIFTTNSLDVLRILDMHQIYLVEKNQYSESTVYRLNQVKGVRSDENFLNKYLTGAYGAFPQISLYEYED